MMIYYNIHGLVRIGCNVEGFFPDYFRCEKPENLDLEILQGDFKKPDLKRFGLFYGDEKSVYFESSFYGAKVYKVLMENLNESTRLLFTKTANTFFNVQKLAFILLEIKLLQKGCTLVHAGAVEKDGKGSLMFGWPGVGKSSTIFGLSDKGFNVLGDDVVILGGDGNILSYPQDVGVFYKSENVKNLRLSASKKIELFLRYAISRLPPFNRYIGCKLMVDLSNIAKIGKGASLEKVFFLEYGSGEEVVEKDVAANKVIASTMQSFFDHYLSNKVFYGYCFVTGFNPGYLESGIRGVLEKTIKVNPTVIKSETKDFFKNFC